MLRCRVTFSCFVVVLNACATERALNPRPAPQPTATESATLAAAPSEPRMRLPILRKQLATQVLEADAPTPPEDILETVYYDAPLGKNLAYVTPARGGKRGPGIVWLRGDGAIDADIWKTGPGRSPILPGSGIAQLYPSWRGSNHNPGRPECFLGEVDDVIAAGAYLATRPDVDPTRIYLAGAHRGAVVALLAAESTTQFRGVFAINAVADRRNNGFFKCLPDDVSEAEALPRIPLEFLSEIVTPTFVLEDEDMALEVFARMRTRLGDAPVQLLELPGAFDPWEEVGPAMQAVVKAIAADSGPDGVLKITQSALLAEFKEKLQPGQRAKPVHRPQQRPPSSAMRLPALRKALATRIYVPDAPVPPKGVLETVYYEAPLGKNIAYVTPLRVDRRSPAIIWLPRELEQGLDDVPWNTWGHESGEDASIYRESGIVELYPALRGTNHNPGRRECFLGEVDDVIAAGKFLASRPDVDPSRIYLAGHNSGAIVALLVAESTDLFRGIFAFEPMQDPLRPPVFACMPSGISEVEARPRSPTEFLGDIVTPTFVVEAEKAANKLFPYLRPHLGSAPVQLIAMPVHKRWASILRPCNVAAARAIVCDSQSETSVQLTQHDLAEALNTKEEREALDGSSP